MSQDLQRYGISLLAQTKLVEIVQGGIRFEREGEIEELAVDTVVMAVGTRACNPLQSKVEQLGLPCQVVGDALKPAMVFDAIHQGFSAGRAIG